jgi:hypothetical protein
VTPEQPGAPPNAGIRRRSTAVEKATGEAVEAAGAAVAAAGRVASGFEAMVQAPTDTEKPKQPPNIRNPAKRGWRRGNGKRRIFGEVTSAAGRVASDAAGRAARGAKDAAGRAARGAKDAAGRAARGAKDAAGRAARGAKDAAGRAARGAKDAAGRAARGAKKGGADLYEKGRKAKEATVQAAGQAATAVAEKMRQARNVTRLLTKKERAQKVLGQLKNGKTPSVKDAIASWSSLANKERKELLRTPGTLKGMAKNPKMVKNLASEWDSLTPEQRNKLSRNPEFKATLLDQWKSLPKNTRNQIPDSLGPAGNPQVTSFLARSCSDGALSKARYQCTWEFKKSEQVGLALSVLLAPLTFLDSIQWYVVDRPYIDLKKTPKKSGTAIRHLKKKGRWYGVFIHHPNKEIDNHVCHVKEGRVKLPEKEPSIEQPHGLSSYLNSLGLKPKCVVLEK